MSKVFDPRQGNSRVFVVLPYAHEALMLLILIISSDKDLNVHNLGGYRVTYGSYNHNLGLFFSVAERGTITAHSILPYLARDFLGCLIMTQYDRLCH